MTPQRIARTPAVSAVLWFASAITGGAGLATLYGLGELADQVSPSAPRAMLLTSLGLLVLSRLWMLVPFSPVGPRLRRWWVDFVLMGAAAAWWGLDHSREPVILRVAAVYSLVIGAGATTRAGLAALIDGWASTSTRRAARRVLAGALFLAVAGGAILTLPRAWAGTYPEPTLYELGTHYLNCVFAATAALTGTGLAVHDLGRDFTRFGHTVILVLMQVGGLAVLVIGTAVGWRFRLWIGWGAPGDDASPARVRRLIWFVCVLALAVEVVGARAIHKTWDFGLDPDLTGQDDRWIDDHAFESVFLAVSAFCNAGLTLSPNSLVGHRDAWAVYAIILPLMVIGSLGGPVLYEMLRRVFRWRDQPGRRLSTDARVTLLGTLVLIAVGAGLLMGIESTTPWQLRYPRAQPVEHLQRPTPQAEAGEMVFSSQDSADVASQRLRTMSTRERARAALFLETSACSGGLWTARLDEASLSPASRVVLMAGMLIGGGLGGTAGGLRVVMVALMLGAIGVRRLDPARPWVSSREVARHRGVATAAAVTAAIVVLIAATTMVLVYRQPASLEAGLFEAVSACSNVGASTGLASQLPLEDRHADDPLGLRLASRIALVLAMLLGRIIPLAIPFWCAVRASTAEPWASEPAPAAHPGNA